MDFFIQGTTRAYQINIEEEIPVGCDQNASRSKPSNYIDVTY